jgi:hypothetical protein
MGTARAAKACSAFGIAAVLLAGCGADEAPAPGSAERPEAMAAQAVHRYFGALAASDAGAACDALTERARRAAAQQLKVDGCEQAMETLIRAIPDDARGALRTIEATAVEIDGDTATTELSRTRFSLPGRADPTRLKREDGEWRIEPVGTDPRRYQTQNCVRGGMDNFDAGGTDPFWRREGRADFREYMTRLCRRMSAHGFDQFESGRPTPETHRLIRRIARRVIVEMIREGRIRYPG